MKILQANAGTLTNFEMLDFLESKRNSHEPISLLESKLSDYLKQSPASNETSESIKEFVEKCKPYNLGKDEILNILNIRPSSSAEILPIVDHLLDQWKPRIKKNLKGLVKLVKEVLPSPATENGNEEEEEEEDDEEEDEDDDA